jgi:UDP-glucose 4-epimerase
MRFLVVGSKGFIGKHVEEYFSGNLVEVYGCDVMTDYTARNYFQIDAANSDYNEIFEAVKFDVCINCSGAASVPDSLAHPYRDYLLNTVNVYKLLEAIRKHAPACRFVNLSSAAVYGNPVSLPVKEDAVCCPVSPYGYHKRQAEVICEEFFRFFGINTCSLRIFSAYGEGLKKQLFWDLSHKATNSTAISLFGTGNESRDFIHVKDIARVIELIIQKGAFTAEYYNVANGTEAMIREVAEEFLNQLGWKGNLSFKGETRVGDPSNWRADISKIRAFGYIPEYNIPEGLKAYVKWLQEEKLV